MPEQNTSPTTWNKKRSVFSVAGGFVVTFVAATVLAVAARSLLPELYPDFHPSAEGRGTVSGLLLNMFFTLIASVGGGFVGAFLARRAQVNHGLAVGVASMLATFAGGASTSAAQPVWYTVGLAIALVLGGGIGGRLRKTQIARGQRKSDGT